MAPPITYLTDCADSNARQRLCARIAALFGATPALFGVAGPNADLEAGLTLLDALQAATQQLGCPAQPSIFLVNVAPRGDTDLWPNGTPFCYFWYRGHLIISTLDGRTLSLIRRYLGVVIVQVVDIATVMKAAAGWTDLSDDQAEMVANTQFRSLWFVPLLARWVWDSQEVPSTEHTLLEIDLEPMVAVVDNFGNCKILADLKVMAFTHGKKLAVHHQRWWRFIWPTRRVRCYERLADVPRGEAALVIGSGAEGFVELVVQRGSASRRFGLKVGDRVF